MPCLCFPTLEEALLDSAVVREPLLIAQQALLICMLRRFQAIHGNQSRLDLMEHLHIACRVVENRMPCHCLSLRRDRAERGALAAACVVVRYGFAIVALVAEVPRCILYAQLIV